MVTMTTLLTNYSDILLPYIKERFPTYNIIHDFKDIKIEFKTCIILDNNVSNEKSTTIFMKKFLKQCSNIVVLIKSNTLPKHLSKFKKIFNKIENCNSFLQRGFNNYLDNFPFIAENWRTLCQKTKVTILKILGTVF